MIGSSNQIYYLVMALYHVFYGYGYDLVFVLLAPGGKQSYWFSLFFAQSFLKKGESIIWHANALMCVFVCNTCLAFGANGENAGIVQKAGTVQNSLADAEFPTRPGCVLASWKPAGWLCKRMSELLDYHGV